MHERCHFHTVWCVFSRQAKLSNVSMLAQWLLIDLTHFNEFFFFFDAFKSLFMFIAALVNRVLFLHFIHIFFSFLHNVLYLSSVCHKKEIESAWLGTLYLYIFPSVNVTSQPPKIAWCSQTLCLRCYHVNLLINSFTSTCINFNVTSL